jgi:CheY-like chemotaxis protein
MKDTDDPAFAPQDGRDPNEVDEPADRRRTGSFKFSFSELARNAAATGLAPRVQLEPAGEKLEHHDVARSTTEVRAARVDMEVRGMPTVLLVEDSDEFAAIVRETLRRIKVDVTHARDGRMATEYLRTHLPDLILLDLNLPDMTGWNILDHAKQEFATVPEGQRPRIIVLTAYNDPANRLVGKLQEVYRFLVKTTTPIELQNVVREALVR